MTNAQSSNKFEEVEVVFEQKSMEVGVITESWFKEEMNETFFLNLEGGVRKRWWYCCLRERGRPCVLSYQWHCCSTSSTRAFMGKSKKLPRSVSAIAVCAVYITTKSPHQPMLLEHFLTSVVYLRSKYPDIGILITVDFNRINISQLTHGNDLHQMRPLT